MRSKPAGLWRGNDRICWVCLLMEEFVGTDSLKHAPAVLAGFEGVSEAPALQRASKAFFNLRQVTTAFSTLEAIRHAVALYNEHHRNAGTRGAYNIHPQTLQFERIDFFEDSDLANARQALRGTLAYAPAGIEMADPAEEMSAVLGDAPDAPRVPIPRITAPLRPRRVHDLTRTPAGRIEVPIAELIEVAHDMDRRDADAPTRRPGKWAERMRRFDLMRPVEGVGLVEGDTLVLEDLRHLIGLPGSGKTTLLVVLGVWVGRRGLKAMLLFPSIEVARQYMADLDFYGANVGMLVGQNPATRRRHAERIAETIAASKGQGGFAATLDGADAFGANCVLPAFARGDTSFWGFGQTACDSIFQGTDNKGRPKRRLCPVWTMCGRNAAPRRLLDADVWVGHVLSMDTAVPAHAADEAIRYFELIARCFDVVVFDEADAVQNQLDHHGAATLRISGAENSVHRVILSQIHDRFARGENHRLMDRNIELYSRQLGEFGNHNYSLVSCVQNFCNDPARRAVAEHFGDHLLTTSRIISEIREGLSRRRARRIDKENWAELRRDLELARAVTDLWDGAAYEAYDDRNGTGRAAWTEADFCAARIGLAADDLRRRRDTLVLLFRRYLAETLTVNRDEIVDQIGGLLLGLCFADGRAVPPGAKTAAVLLVSVTFMIVGYQRIVPGTAAMVAEGLIPDPVVEATASPDLRRFIPESVMGSLSGVRYSTSRAGSSRSAAVNVGLSYITLVGAPRMLMHRFHRLLAAEGVPGPAVLLTSATSFLEPSPTYHIDSGPHYLLRPKEAEHDASQSVYRFKWIADREHGDDPLRYSGAGEMAAGNLTKMVEALVRNGRKSEVYKSIQNFDVRRGVARKAAFVVNGYDQARAVKRYIDDFHRDTGRRTKAVVRSLERGEQPSDYVTPAQAEALGDDENCDIVVLPMAALGRGINVVFTKGPRERDAAIGSIYFLTRPHPSADDMQLLLGLAGRAAQNLDRTRFPVEATLDDIAAEVHRVRDEAFFLARRLLQEPLMASRLGKRLFRHFTANQMVNILQTIGRGMRNGCPVAVYFVDAAWAIKSTKGDPEIPDTERGSMLVQMRAILEECVAHPDPAIREIYRELYGAFLEPLRRVEGVVFPPHMRPPGEDDAEDDWAHDDVLEEL